MVFISSIITVICVLVAVAFYTLYERKILGYLQVRKGPKSVGFWGVFQPFADAIKLFINDELVTPVSSNKILFWMAPMLAFFLSYFSWILFPSMYSVKFMSFGLLLFFCISAVNVYSVLMAGWTSNSKYAFLGSMRAAAQTISYEVSMLLVLMFPIMLVLETNMDLGISSFSVFLLLIPSIFVWFSTTLAETNRAPFDFAEGESEIVSGFNIEYGGGMFALLFLAEYANIIFMSMMTMVWYIKSINFLCFSLGVLIFSTFFLLCRGAFPRHRYDLLMMLCWKSFLPFSIFSLFLCLI
uniref:NADH dehydrogenase subunit 1 n=1 Tax=Bulinus globosus TaxID=157967 RepID=UPI001EDE5103|nr:NADH dehydrogenase subunit 1 [Bulinus globosus]QYJ56670.1 NADH dehydrogenase subunit 1 [Bulinus globosus]